MRYELRSTRQFERWLVGLKDSSVKTKVLARLARVETGNFGDCKQISPALFEMRLFFGAGLRIYYTIRDNTVVFLLTGGDKSTQARDISNAARLLKELQHED